MPIILRVPIEDKLPDSPSWINRFEYHSGSGSTYTIAQNRQSLHVGCSCPRWRFKRTCKHLAALGLPGGVTPCDVRIEIIQPSSYRPAPAAKPVTGLAALFSASDYPKTKRPRRVAPQPPAEPSPAAPVKSKRGYYFDD